MELALCKEMMLVEKTEQHIHRILGCRYSRKRGRRVCILSDDINSGKANHNSLLVPLHERAWYIELS